MRFNERALRRAMIDAGIDTWGELVEKSGVNRKTLYNIRVGQSCGSIDDAFNIKKALNLTRNQFFEIFQED